jgi:hypothetical protein
LRLVFSRIASLPGASADAATLGELGAAVGRAIYFVDALEDLDDDVRKGAFNPCILQGRRDEKRVQETARLLRGNVDGLAPLLDALPLVRHSRVLRDILGELRARAMRAVEGVRRAPESRLRALVVAMAVFLWAMLCAVPRVLAAAPKRDAGKHHHDAGLHDAGADAGPDASAWGPLVLPEEDAGLPELPTDRKEEPKSSEKGSDKAKEKDAKPSGGWGGCPDCGKPLRDCKECCEAPSHCCDSCGGCCKGCSDCCSGCDNCGQSCGDCGNCCNSCGNCCK